MFAAGGLSAILVSLVVGQLGLPRRHITFMYGLWLIGSIQVAAYALAECHGRRWRSRSPGRAAGPGA